MNEVLLLVLFFAFSVRTIRNVFYQVFLWQLKEYRFDRIQAHLKTWQGRRLILHPFSLIKYFLIALYFFSFPIFPLVVALYIFEAGFNLKELAKKSLKKPLFTLKAGVIVAVVIALELTLFTWQPIDKSLWVLLLDKCLPLLVMIIVACLAIPTAIQREIIIYRARKIIEERKDLLVIGITGSFGKTSTKEYLTSILNEKFKVLKTPKSNNTAIGIAKTVINDLTDQKIFVCEIAAYKKGEIRDICLIVRPQIGIITGINEQHLDLFGTLENTIEAKYELIEALPKNGLAVFNGNNKYTLQLAERARKSGLKVLVYRYIETMANGLADAVARDIKVVPEGLEFEVQLGEERQKFTAKLLGKQNVENIFAGLLVASYLGMSLPEIAKAVEKLAPPLMTMNPFNGPNGAVLIDDSFNANPAGVLAAVEYAKVYRGKKILVLQPMIELGEASDQAHRQVGKEAAKICDYIFLTNKNFSKPFLEGAGEYGYKIQILDNKTIAERIKKVVDKESVVIFEGKESARILSCLVKDA